MTDETPPESLILAHLQAIRSDINNLKLTVQDLAQQVISVRKHLVSMNSE